MNDLEFSEAVKNMRNRTTRMERAGGYWSPEEKQRLEHLFFTGVGITEMAVRLQRTEPAVIQQIEKQDLYQRSQYHQRRRNPRGHCGCLYTKDSCEFLPCPAIPVLASFFRIMSVDCYRIH